MSEEMKKIEELCKPVVDYLKENCHPHCSIVITMDRIELLSAIIGIPVDKKVE